MPKKNNSANEPEGFSEVDKASLISAAEEVLESPVKKKKKSKKVVEENDIIEAPIDKVKIEKDVDEHRKKKSKRNRGNELQQNGNIENGFADESLLCDILETKISEKSKKKKNKSKEIDENTEQELADSDRKEKRKKKKKRSAEELENDSNVIEETESKRRKIETDDDEKIIQQENTFNKSNKDMFLNKLTELVREKVSVKYDENLEKGLNGIHGIEAEIMEVIKKLRYDIIEPVIEKSSENLTDEVSSNDAITEKEKQDIATNGIIENEQLSVEDTEKKIVVKDVSESTQKSIEDIIFANNALELEEVSEEEWDYENVGNETLEQEQQSGEDSKDENIVNETLEDLQQSAGGSEDKNIANDAAENEEESEESSDEEIITNGNIESKKESNVQESAENNGALVASPFVKIFTKDKNSKLVDIRSVLKQHKENIEFIFAENSFLGSNITKLSGYPDFLPEPSKSD